MKIKPYVLIVLFLIFAVLPPISNYGIRQALSFDIWFMLTVIYTFLFIGSYQMMVNDSIGIFVMALFVCLGIALFTSLKDGKYFEILNFYVVYSLAAGSLTMLITKKILKL